jgi:hypothetical protein
MHPLVTNLNELKDSEVEARISDLTKKYFMSPNPELRAQVSAVLDTYKEEMSKRRQEALKKLMDTRDKSLDKLINVQ